MRSIPSYGVVALASAIVGILLWRSIRDVAWQEYRSAAEHLRGEAFIRIGDPEPLTRPDWDPADVCAPLERVTGLSSFEIATTIEWLGETSIYTVDHENLALRTNVPLSAIRCAKRTPVLALTPKRRAAPRRELPDSISP